MTGPRCRRAGSGTDVMNATLGRHVLYALIACSLAGPAYPADPGASGAENGQPSDAIQRREPAGVAENAKRDAARRDGSIKSTETTTRGRSSWYWSTHWTLSKSNESQYRSVPG